MRIETIFGAVAVLALGVLAGIALTSNKDVQAATSRDGGAIAAIGADVCGCYDRAYEAARSDPDYTRPTYEGGYDACRKSAGRAGGGAWSAGWDAAMAGRRRACRG